MSSKFWPREGFYIDPLASLLRKTVLSPWVNLSCIFLVWTSGVVLKGLLMRTPLWEGFLYRIFTTLLFVGTVLNTNDYLDRQIHNNWTDDATWNWDKEIVLITGGSSGIGASVAQTLVARNNKTRVVIIDYISLTFSPPIGSKIYFYRCDLSHTTSIKDTCATIKQEIGDPSVVFNNAGLARGMTVMEGSYRDVDLTLKVNLVAPFIVLKEFLPGMVHRNHGHILATSSMSSIIPPALLADYGASKAGLATLHESLALELAHKYKAPRIRTSLITLSFVETPMFKGQTNQSHFIAPLLKTGSVSDAIVNLLYSGYGKNIYMPGIMRYIASARGWPSWMLRILAERTEDLRVDFHGRQKLDPTTGNLTEK